MTAKIITLDQFTTLLEESEILTKISLNASSTAYTINHSGRQQTIIHTAVETYLIE